MHYLAVLILLVCEQASAQVTPQIAAKVIGADWSSKCSIIPADPASDPDKALTTGSFLKRSKHSFEDVLNSGGETTDGERNAGIAAYMTKSLLADDRLFNAAYAFYSKIKERDKADSRTLCAIESTGANSDAFTLAKAAAHGDVYLAMKVMAMLTHDNLQNHVGKDKDNETDCRLRVLNKIRPDVSSSLFCNGALPGLNYKKSDIDRGVEIAKQCNKENFLGAW